MSAKPVDRVAVAIDVHHLHPRRQGSELVLRHDRRVRIPVADPVLQRGDDIAVALAREATQRRVDEHGERCVVAWDASGSTPMVDHRMALQRRSLRTG